MKFFVFLTLAVLVVGQDHGNHGHSGVEHGHHMNSILNQLRHMFEHALDLNRDGVLTLDEELRYFHNHDPNGDCKMDYNEFSASRDMQLHGNMKPTVEQMRGAFLYYDTKGGSMHPDGYYTCDDIPYFFGLVDVDGNGKVTLAEFDKGLFHIADEMAHLVVGLQKSTLPPVSTAA